MIVGVNSHGLDLYNEILKYPELGYRAQGIFGFKKRPAKKSLNFPFLGKLMHLPEDIYKRYDVIFDVSPEPVRNTILSKFAEDQLKSNPGTISVKYGAVVIVFPALSTTVALIIIY